MSTKRVGGEPFNPNLVGYRKCYHCLRFYDGSKEHVCYDINRIKDWNFKLGKRKIHSPFQDEPANLEKEYYERKHKRKD